MKYNYWDYNIIPVEDASALCTIIKFKFRFNTNTYYYLVINGSVDVTDTAL